MYVPSPEGVPLMLIVSTSGIHLHLAEVNFDFLCAGFVCDYDLTWHICSFFIFCFIFYFYQPRFLAALSFAERARGLITNSIFSATIGFLLINVSSDSSPRLAACLKESFTKRSSRL